MHNRDCPPPGRCRMPASIDRPDSYTRLGVRISAPLRGITHTMERGGGPSALITAALSRAWRANPVWKRLPTDAGISVAIKK